MKPRNIQIVAHENKNELIIRTSTSRSVRVFLLAALGWFILLIVPMLLVVLRIDSKLLEGYCVLYGFATVILGGLLAFDGVKHLPVLRNPFTVEMSGLVKFLWCVLIVHIGILFLTQYIWVYSLWILWLLLPIATYLFTRTRISIVKSNHQVLIVCGLFLKKILLFDQDDFDEINMTIDGANITGPFLNISEKIFIASKLKRFASQPIELIENEAVFVGPVENKEEKVKVKIKTIAEA